MAINSLSPAFIKFNYTRGTVKHKAVVPTKFSATPTAGVMPSLLTHVGGAQAFNLAVGDWGIFVRPLFGTTTTLDNAEVWYQPTPADDPIWIFTQGINLPGTSATANVPAEEVVMTFRSSNGGLFRNYFMESFLPANQVTTYGAMANPWLDYANWVIGSSGWMYARDNGKPVVCLGFKTKYNDVLRRRLLTG